MRDRRATRRRFHFCIERFQDLGRLFLQLCSFVVLAGWSAEVTHGHAPGRQILWARRFRATTISAPGFNLFNPLRRHFRAARSCRRPLAPRSRRNVAVHDRLGGLSVTAAREQERLVDLWRGRSPERLGAPAPAARRAFLEAAGGPPAGETGLREIEIPSAFCEFSKLCRAENFPVGRDADAVVRATGVRPRPEAATLPIVSRSDAVSPRRRRASAGRCARLVAAI